MAKELSKGKTLDAIARERGLKTFDPKDFEGIWPPGEDMDAFLAEVYSSRT